MTRRPHPWRRWVFWPLLPLVAPQGLWIRRVAPRFPAAEGPTAGCVGTGESLSVVAVGDSIIAGVGAPTLEDAMPGRFAAALASRLGRRVHWSAHGQVGARASDTLETLVPSLAPEPFDVAVISIGVNDVTGLRSTGRWRSELEILLQRLHDHSPDATIVLAGLPPLWGFPLLPQPLRYVFGSRAQTFDTIAEDVASAHPGCLFVPTEFEPTPEKFSPDGYHPSAASHAEWGEGLAEAVEPHLG